MGKREEVEVVCYRCRSMAGQQKKKTGTRKSHAAFPFPIADVCVKVARECLVSLRVELPKKEHNNNNNKSVCRPKSQRTDVFFIRHNSLLHQSPATFTLTRTHTKHKSTDRSSPRLAAASVVFGASQGTSGASSGTSLIIISKGSPSRNQQQHHKNSLKLSAPRGRRSRSSGEAAA